MALRSRRDTLHRAAQVRRVALVSTLFVAMVIAAVVIERTFVNPVRSHLATPTVETEVSHVGTIRLAPNRQGRCPEMHFDNDTGVLSPAGTAACDPDDQPPPRWGSSGTGRMDSIREGFRHR